MNTGTVVGVRQEELSTSGRSFVEAYELIERHAMPATEASDKKVLYMLYSYSRTRSVNGVRVFVASVADSPNPVLIELTVAIGRITYMRLEEHYGTFWLKPGKPGYAIKDFIVEKLLAAMGSAHGGYYTQAL